MHQINSFFNALKANTTSFVECSTVESNKDDTLPLTVGRYFRWEDMMAKQSMDLSKTLGFDLPTREKAIVINEPAAAGFDPVLRESVSMYRDLGYAVMQTAYASYLYQTMGPGPAREMSQIVQGCVRRIGSALMSRYGLEEYVVRGNIVTHGNKEQIGIAQRLVAALYHVRGFLFVYDFLVPVFEIIAGQKDMNYKGIVQHYAQKRRLEYDYDTKMSGGTAHEPIFESCLSVGSRYTIGSGRSKKLAESDAAMKYVRRFGLNEPTKRKATGSEVITAPTRHRAAQLHDAVKALGLDGSTITIPQLDAAFTHISYLDMHPNARIDARQHLIGASVFNMLSFDYAIGHFSLNQDLMKRLRNHITSDAYIANAAAKEINRYVLLGRSSLNAGTIKQDRLRSDTVKNVVGTLWSNYCKSRDEGVGKKTIDFVNKVFDSGTVDTTQFLMTTVQEVAQEYGLDYKESVERLPYGTQVKPVYRVDVTISETDWCTKSAGTGGSIKSARNRALQSIVLSLSKRYPNNKALVTLNMYANPEKYIVMELTNECGPSGGSERSDIDTRLNDGIARKEQTNGADSLIHGSDLAEDTINDPTSVSSVPQNQDVDLTEDARNEPAPAVVKHLTVIRQLKHKQFENVSFTGSERVLHICKGTRSCRERGHTITCVTGLFTGITGKLMRVNVNYCEECNVYFLGYREYCYYRDTYGGVLGSYVFDFATSYDRGYNGWSSESPLMMCGYSVSQTQDLSPEQRHLILANVMDRGICSKARVIEYLQYFIANREGQWNMQLACSKWREDLAWVRNYRIDSQKGVTLAGVRRFR